jgi:hypothetical protein
LTLYFIVGKRICWEEVKSMTFAGNLLGHFPENKLPPKTPRTPSEREKHELVEYLIKADPQNYSDQPEVARELVDHSWIAVFDDHEYGKAMVVIWEGSTSYVQAFLWIRGINSGEEHLPLGEIDWHDGKHEPTLERVEIDTTLP